MANLDWTLGYMRHETNWFWSCISSYLSDGRHFLLNLSMGVNETGVSENACWLDGQIFHGVSQLATYTSKAYIRTIAGARSPHLCPAHLPLQLRRSRGAVRALPVPQAPP